MIHENSLQPASDMLLERILPAPTNRASSSAARNLSIKSCQPHSDSSPLLGTAINGRLLVAVSEQELCAAEVIAASRPSPLRDYDQISMHAGDLLRQAKLMQPYLSGKRVVFIGDNDGASLLLGILGAMGAPCPSSMLLLDFDRRILANARRLADRYKFADRLETRAYNVFDPLPSKLIGQYDWFYTNPPYGSHNQGASARLFMARGMSLCRIKGWGCIILPDDNERLWTQSSMLATQGFLTQADWMVREKINSLHAYNLESDPRLTSSTMLVSEVAERRRIQNLLFLPDNAIPQKDISNFYGRSVIPPYPHYIKENGQFDFNWDTESQKDTESQIDAD